MNILKSMNTCHLAAHVFLDQLSQLAGGYAGRCTMSYHRNAIKAHIHWPGPAQLDQWVVSIPGHLLLHASCIQWDSDWYGNLQARTQHIEVLQGSTIRIFEQLLSRTTCAMRIQKPVHFKHQRIHRVRCPKPDYTCHGGVRLRWELCESLALPFSADGIAFREVPPLCLLSGGGACEASTMLAVFWNVDTDQSFCRPFECKRGEIWHLPSLRSVRGGAIFLGPLDS